MMSTRQMVGFAVVYTLVVSVAISLTNVPGAVVFGIAACWFSVGRMVGRGDAVPTRRTRWGRQP